MTRHRLSLRAELSLILTAFVLVACATVGIASTLALRGFLLQRLDQQLALAGNRYTVALEHDDHDSDNATSTMVGQPIGTIGARAVGGRVTQSGIVADADQPTTLAPRDVAVLARLRRGRGTVDLPGLGEYRLMITPGHDGDVLITGLPEHGLHDTLAHEMAVEGIVFTVVVLASAGLGLMLIRRSLTPLRDMTTTALRISELPLAGDPELPERIADGDSRTEIGQLSLAVNHMLDQVEAALQQRQQSEDRLREFAADASHELRTPVAVIRSHSELIAQQAQQLPEQLQNSLERITSESARMGRLVDELLLLARLDAGQPLQRVEVDLSRIALDAVDDARLTAPDHRWTLQVPGEPVSAPGDPDRLAQVVVNLLANARVHTPPGTLVRLSLTSTSESALLQVVDDGPGISADLLPRITERFVRSDGSRNRSKTASGLGLAIVSGVIDAHGGTVRISSGSGGTTIDVELPSA